MKAMLTAGAAALLLAAAPAVLAQTATEPTAATRQADENRDECRVERPTGSKLKVIGRSIATVAVGPMPGSTPTAVPSATPMRQNRTFCHCSAVWKPRSRLSKSSRSASQPVADQRQPLLQRQDEDEPARHGQDHRGQQGLTHGRLLPRERGQQHRAERAEQQPEALEGDLRPIRDR